MEKLKIGITIGLKDNKESIWTNGIKQNILMLTRLLKNSKNNYEIKLLNTIEVDWSTKPSYLKDIDICTFKDNFMDVDLLIVIMRINHAFCQFIPHSKFKSVIHITLPHTL